MTKLTVMQILEIENLSMHGCGVDTIACHLGLTPVAFHDLADADERVRDAILLGRHRGIAAVAKSLFASAISGRDAGASKFWLERLAGGEFRPPRANPIIIVEAAKPGPDDDRQVLEMDRRFERHRLLMQGRDVDPDGNIIDLDVVPTKVPPPNDAGDG